MSLLPDGGFENTLALTGGGPLGNEIPKLNPQPFISQFVSRQIGSLLLWPSDDTQAAVVGGLGSPHSWIQQNHEIPTLLGLHHWKIANFPEISRGGPGSGFETTDALAQTGVACAMLEATIETIISATLLASDIQTCFDFEGSGVAIDPFLGEVDDGSEKRMVGWRVDPGAVIDMTIRVKGLFGSATSGFEVTYYSRFGFVSKLLSAFTVSTSYATKTLSAVVPEGVKYAKIGVRVDDLFRDGVIVVDEATLNITGQSLEREQEDNGRYKVAINFEGRSLKGYGNIHKVDKKSAPVEVTL